MIEGENEGTGGESGEAGSNRSGAEQTRAGAERTGTAGSSTLLYEANRDEPPAWSGEVGERIRTETKGRLSDLDGLIKSYGEANGLLSKRVQELPAGAILDLIKGQENGADAVKALAADLGLIPTAPDEYENVRELLEQFSDGTIVYDEAITSAVMAKFKDAGFTQAQMEIALEQGVMEIVRNLAQNGPQVNVEAEREKFQKLVGKDHAKIGARTIKFARAHIPSDLLNQLGRTAQGLYLLRKWSDQFGDSELMDDGTPSPGMSGIELRAELRRLFDHPGFDNVHDPDHKALKARAAQLSQALERTKR